MFLMKRVIHRDLMRGHLAQSAAILLYLALLMALAAAVLHGVRTLQA